MNSQGGLMEFPCDFTIKIVGNKSDRFELEVLSIIHKHVVDLKEDSIKTRLSKDSKYLSLSITILAISQAQLDDIYRELTANPHVIIAL